MRLNSMVMLGVALVLGISAALLSKLWLQSQVSEPQVAEAPAKAAVATIVVARKGLRFGDTLTAAALREIDWPDEAIPKGASRKISDVVNGKDRRVVLSAIEANEPILNWKVTGPGQRASLAALITPGKNAVTVRVNDVLGVAGFVLPGERVDVLLTRTQATGQRVEENNAFTDVLLTNVRVLAVDQLADDRTEKPEPAKAVTLEVDARQAQKVALAATVGNLSLALRSAGSQKVGSVSRVALSDLGSAPSNVSTDASVIVTVVRNEARSDYSVPQAQN